MPRLRQPAYIRLFNRLGQTLVQRGLSLPNLQAVTLTRKAMRRTRLVDWGDDSWRDGLNLLVEDLNQSAHLSQTGRIAAYLNLLDHLSVRLNLIDHRKQHPQIADQRIDRPLFILGLPRTGTSILHELLACDPSLRAPATWEVAKPMTPPVGADDRRSVHTGRLLSLLEQLSPGFKTIHALGAELPQECVYILASAMLSEQFGYMYNVPNYRDALLRRDMSCAYRWHRQFLQHLQPSAPHRRWVLKTPAHLGQLKALLSVYPDALIVWTHRRPLQAVASFASLLRTLRSGFSDRVDPRAIGEYEVRHAAANLERGLSARAELDEQQFIDVDFQAICEDPLAAIERIYQHFGFAPGPGAHSRMRRYLAQRPRDLYGVHHYSADEFGLDTEVEARWFDEYLRAHHAG
ncbi:MAG: sulfotransferase [Pseudomonadota bacterium]